MTSQDVRRILVALDASAHSHAALEEAAALAAPLQAELTGIFVLDAELLRLSALPLASETGLTSAKRRALDPESMERALRLQAEQARTALADIAKHHRLQSSFRLTRGNVLAELLEAATQTDLLAIGFMGHMGMSGRRLGTTVRGVTAGATCSVLLLSPVVRKGRSVVVVYGQSANAARALEIALQLADRRGADLVVLLCGAETALTALQDSAMETASKAGVQPTFEMIDPAGFDDLNVVMQRLDCGLVVIGRDCELIEGRDDQLGSLDAPVLLAR